MQTVTFFPHYIPFPRVDLEDFLRQAATDIIHILTQPPKFNGPVLKAGDTTRNALLEIATLLKRTEKIPILPELQEATHEGLSLKKIQTMPTTVPEPRVSAEQKNTSQQKVSQQS